MLIGNDTGPQTTAEEDLAYLGLGSLMEDRAAPQRPSRYLSEDDDLDEAKKKHAGHKMAGHMGHDDEEGMDDSGRTNVAVRKEDDDEDDHDDDDDEMDEDVDLGGLDADDFALAEALLNLDESDLEDLDEDEMDALLAVFDTDLIEQATAALAEDDDLARYNGALSVLDVFYEQVNNLQEGDEQPSYDELVGVIEAYEALAEETGLLTEKFRGAMKAKLKRGRKRAMRGAKGKKRARLLGRAHKRGKFVVGGQVMTKSQKLKSLRKAIKGAKGKYAKSLRDKLKSARGSGKRSGPMAGYSESTEELVQNLRDLRNAVEESGEHASAANELIEGFGSLEAVAKEYYERIAAEVSEDEDVAEDDSRVTMGRHLERIAQDAGKRAAAIAEGDDRWSLDQFAEDLQAIAADLDDAMEAMKSID